MRKIAKLVLILMILLIGTIYTTIAADAKKKVTESSEVFGLAQNVTIVNASLVGVIELANLTFYLPTDSYVFAKGSGEVDLGYSLLVVLIRMDNNSNDDFSTERIYGTQQSCNIGCFFGFETGRVYHLDAGYHTVYLDADLHNPEEGVIFYTNLALNVIANSAGSFKQVDWTAVGLDDVNAAKIKRGYNNLKKNHRIIDGVKKATPSISYQEEV